MFGREWQIVWNVQVFEDLLRNSAKYRSGDLSTLVEANSRIEDNGDYDLRVVDWGESCEGTDVLRLRVSAACRINSS